MFLGLISYIFLTAAVVQDPSSYILAPDSRTIHPASIFKINGPITNAASLLGSANGNAQFSGSSSVTFDHGKNIAGVVSVTVGTYSSPGATISLTYTESSLYINNISCDMTAGPQFDEPISLPVGQGPGTYTVDRHHERGAFRYLTLTASNDASILVTSVSTQFTASPVAHDLRHYSGYFHANDEKLNRIWYAGAYTNQLCTIDPHYGADTLPTKSGTKMKRDTIPWGMNNVIANSTTVLTDGAKRDREIWPGDLVVQIPSVFVSTNDMASIENSLNALLDLQHPDGMLPYAGFPFNLFNDVSFTYHLHTLIAIAYYFHYTGNLNYVKGVWDHFTRAVAWSLGSVDSYGLMFVTSDKDWLRGDMTAHNIEANAILYYALNQGINLANLVGDTASASAWGPVASKVKRAINDLLWDADSNLYKDNEGSTLHPQDGNVWAVKAGVTTSDSQNEAISSALKSRWGKYGAPAPETGSPATISPFIGSLELEAHFLSNAPQNAIDLMRLQWYDFMLEDPRMTNSTFIEGYSETGELHYPLYANDAVISHSHGWSTGPTSALSFYVAGLQLVTESGKTWRIAPQVGDLTSVRAGFVTALGSFYVEIEADGKGKFTKFRFNTPPGTTGSVNLSGNTGMLVDEGRKDRRQTDNAGDELTGFPGGDWTFIPDT